MLDIVEKFRYDFFYMVCDGVGWGCYLKWCNGVIEYIFGFYSEL